MLALLDCDVFRYRYGFAAQKKLEDGTLRLEPKTEVIWAIDAGIKKILRETNSKDYVGFLSGSTNFRTEIYPEYKANRKDSEKPAYFQFITDTLLFIHDSHVIEGKEADDELAAQQYKYKDDVVICTTDKDLDQVPGWKYNFVKSQMYYVTPDEAEWNRQMQILTGDTVDNIPGLKGIGPKTAEKILLEGLDKGKDMDYIVQQEYAKRYPEDWMKQWQLNSDLITMTNEISVDIEELVNAAKT